MRRHLATAALAACTGAGPARAAIDTYFPPEDFRSEALYATSFTTPSARAAGLAGAYAAIADDASALVYNPAGLAQLVRIEVTGGVLSQHVRTRNDFFGARATRSAPASAVDDAAVAYPVPTYRGSFVVGAGIFRIRTNESASERFDRRTWDAGSETVVFEDRFLRRQEGGVYRVTGGFGVDVLPNLSFGGSLSYWTGTLKDDQFRRIDERFQGALPLTEDRLVTRTSVAGASFDLGLMGYAGRGTRWGLVLRSPAWLRLEGDGRYTQDDLTDTEPATVGFLLVDQEPRLPWSVTAGVSQFAGPFLWTGEAEYQAWDEVNLDDGFTTAALPGEGPDYTARAVVRTGVEFSTPRIPVRLRGGYAYGRPPYDLFLGLPARRISGTHLWTGGAGVLVGGMVALDAAFAWTAAETGDRDETAVTEERRNRSLTFTASYRY